MIVDFPSLTEAKSGRMLIRSLQQASMAVTVKPYKTNHLELRPDCDTSTNWPAPLRPFTFRWKRQTTGSEYLLCCNAAICPASFRFCHPPSNTACAAAVSHSQLELNVDGSALPSASKQTSANYPLDTSSCSPSFSRYSTVSAFTCERLPHDTQRRIV